MWKPFPTKFVLKPREGARKKKPKEVASGGLGAFHALSIHNVTSNSWILESRATYHIISKTSIITEPKATVISCVMQELAWGR